MVILLQKAHHVSATVGMNYEKQQNHDLLGYRTDVLSETLNDLNLATGTGLQTSKPQEAHLLTNCSAFSLEPIIIIKNVTY